MVSNLGPKHNPDFVLGDKILDDSFNKPRKYPLNKSFEDDALLNSVRNENGLLAKIKKKIHFDKERNVITFHAEIPIDENTQAIAKKIFKDPDKVTRIDKLTKRKSVFQIRKDLKESFELMNKKIKKERGNDEDLPINIQITYVKKRKTLDEHGIKKTFKEIVETKTIEDVEITSFEDSEDELSVALNEYLTVLRNRRGSKPFQGFVLDSSPAVEEDHKIWEDDKNILSKTVKTIEIPEFHFNSRERHEWKTEVPDQVQKELYKKKEGWIELDRKKKMLIATDIKENNKKKRKKEKQYKLDLIARENSNNRILESEKQHSHRNKKDMYMEDKEDAIRKSEHHLHHQPRHR